MKDKIAVSILINGALVPNWIYTCIDNLASAGSAEVTLVINKFNLTSLSSGKRKKIRLGLLLIKLLERIDFLIFRIQNNYNLKRRVTGIENIAVFYDPHQTVNDKNNTNNWLNDALRKLSPDVIVQFGKPSLSKEILTIPRYGAWSFSVASTMVPGGVDYGLWEVVRYTPVSCSSLEQIADDQGDSETIFRALESTCPFSINKNRNKIFFRATLYLPRLIEGLRLYGAAYLSQQKERSAITDSLIREEEIKLSLTAALRDMGSFLFRVSGLVLNKLLYTDAFRWKLMIHIAGHDRGFSTDFGSFREVMSPRGLFWADPFVVGGEEHYYLFVEEYIYRKKKAHISVLELDREGRLQKHYPVIARSYHMSYPFVFKLENSYYMIPETAANNTIELYRCTRFPDKWEFDRIIMEDLSATDTTLFSHMGKWWLFTTLDQTNSVSGGSTELFLYYSDDPLSGSWISHPLNPVVSDERSARCAGNLFLHQGVIYRPAQDCSVRYGRGFSLKRVTILNEFEYNEVTESEIKPGWDSKLKGTHTFNFESGLTVIDTYTFHGRLAVN
ncbi:MAG: hypothetical protein IH591_13180 [Bacteroidales bacterium]|nr:hypothetical protein [Bacteroidales bacterium]